MKHNELKELIRQVVKEESEYNKLFAHMLHRTGMGLNDMTKNEKSKFFDAVDKAWKAKTEGKLMGIPEELFGNQKKLDVDGDGKIDGDDLAKLRKEK